ncbi:Voltage-dependent anion-selective channel protein 1 [Cricetulus griseus]|uniref:Non-selective voltage-gated ion channel VDAC1 n=1 Tax=Cricetulus griseus TaxID=10029 RepID=G3GYF0_CRIGR|nr:Voltage-dependent anion-selective channel protein 1 [Cricetulus griseus]
MPVPPTYADGGKSARDTFTKGYGFGLIKLDLETKSEIGIYQLRLPQRRDHQSERQPGNQHRWTEYGLTLREKWNTDNTLVGYKTDEFQFHTSVNDGTEFGGSIYRKVNKKLKTAINPAWTAGNSNTRFGIAAKYQVDPDACFSAKVNNSNLIGLGS